MPAIRNLCASFTAGPSAKTCDVTFMRSAIETFVRGHCFMKSFAYPYVYEEVSGLWIMRDGIGDKPRRIPRRSEVVAYGMAPAEVARIAREQEVGKHFVSHMHGLEDSPRDIRDAYKALGYRSMLSEEFFVHDMENIPEIASKPQVRRVVSIDDSDMIKVHRRNHKAIRDCDLNTEHPEHRLYAVIEGNRAYGWVGSVPFGAEAWVADLFVVNEQRRKGYGRALMSAMMLAEREKGIRRCVLLASKEGALLYPQLGYRHIGTLQLFCPKR